jgi:hypoxia up-regulated 1
MKVTRQAFESACADMKNRFVQPIFDALDNANLTLVCYSTLATCEKYAKVIPIGRYRLCYIDWWGVADTNGEGGAGSCRGRVRHLVLFILRQITESCRDKLAMNVNSDEAAVLGAALHGASLSRQFRTKNIKLSDIAPYDVQVSYLAEVKTDARTRRARSRRRRLRGAHGRARARRLRSDARTTFRSRFRTRNRRRADSPSTCSTRVSPASRRRSLISPRRAASIPVIKATILFSESGFVSVPEAVAYAELKDDSITGTRLLAVGCCLLIYAACRKAQGIIWRLVSGRWVNLDRGRIFVFVFCLTQGN